MDEGPDASDPLFVDVSLRRGDVNVWASLTSADPRRQWTARMYHHLRTAALTATLVAALLHPEMWVLWVAVLAGLAAVAIEIRARRTPPPLSAFVAMNGRFSVSPHGLTRTSDVSESVIRWAAVERISQTGTHVVVRFPGGIWVLPFRCFASNQHRDEFVEAMQGNLARAANPT